MWDGERGAEENVVVACVCSTVCLRRDHLFHVETQDRGVLLLAFLVDNVLPDVQGGILLLLQLSKIPFLSSVLSSLSGQDFLLSRTHSILSPYVALMVSCIFGILARDSLCSVPCISL